LVLILLVALHHVIYRFVFSLTYHVLHQLTKRRI
jgi:hypothetical protein